MNRIPRSLFNLAIVAVLVALTVPTTGCPSSKQSVSIALDGLSIACNVAVPFAGEYAGFVSLGAQVAQNAANELLTQDTALVQSEKIINMAQNLLNHSPVLINASTQTKAVIMAIEVAAQGVIAILQSQINATKTYAAASPSARSKAQAAASNPLALSTKDAAAVAHCIITSNKTMKALGR